MIEVYVEEKGNYQLELSFLAKAKKGRIFIHKNKSYIDQIIPKSCIMLPTTDHFVPVTLITNVYIEEAQSQTF